MTAEQFAYLTSIECDLPAVFATEIAAIIQRKIDQHARLKEYGAPRVCVNVPIALEFNGVTLRDRVIWDSAHCCGCEIEEFSQACIAELSLASAFIAPFAFTIRNKIFHEQMRVLNEFLKGNTDSAPKNEFSGPITTRTGPSLTLNGPIITPAAAANNISDSTIVNLSSLAETNSDLQQKPSKIVAPNVLT